MSTKNPLPFSNQFERGHSFNWAGTWTAGKYYFNDAYVTDFVVYNNCILRCRSSHEASEALKPIIIFDNGIPVGVEGVLWEFITSSLDHNAIQFLTMDQYEELVNTGQVVPNTIYYIYEND